MNNPREEAEKITDEIKHFIVMNGISKLWNYKYIIKDLSLKRVQSIINEYENHILMNYDKDIEKLYLEEIKSREYVVDIRQWRIRHKLWQEVKQIIKNEY